MFKLLLLLVAVVLSACSQEGPVSGIVESHNFLNGTIKTDKGELIDGAKVVLYKEQTALGKMMKKEALLTAIDSMISTNGTFIFQLSTEGIYSIKAFVLDSLVSQRLGFDYKFNMNLDLVVSSGNGGDDSSGIDGNLDTLQNDTTHNISGFYKVAKEQDTYGAQFTTIQEAIDYAGENSIILIMDGEVYNEQLLIEEKKNITILSSSYNTSSFALSSNPTVVWQDDKNFGPYTYEESLDSILSTNYLTNGAIRIKNSENIRIQGINVDGIEVLPHQNENVYEGKYPVVCGNSGVSIYNSKNIQIRGSKIENCYAGVLMSNIFFGTIDGDISNTDAIYSSINATMNNDVIVNLPALDSTIEGVYGNHIIERNVFIHNGTGVMIDGDYDKGSTFRFNKFYENRYERTNVNFRGSAITLKGVRSQNKFYNNTFYNNDAVISHQYWIVARSTLFERNIISNDYANQDQQDTQLEATGNFYNNRSNVVEVRDSVIEHDAFWGNVYRVKYKGYLLPGSGPYSFEDNDVFVSNSEPMLLYSSIQANEFDTDENALSKGNYAVSSIEFTSTDPNSPDFLKPVATSDDQISFLLAKGENGYYPEDWNYTIKFIGAEPVE